MSLLQIGALTRKEIAFNANATATQALQPNAKASVSLKTEINPPPPQFSALNQ
jgi:hypothetical protein